MLEDHKRTGAYYNACMQNRAQFAGKVVLDVGTGSGILAIFAAKAGARKVFAVEATSMAKHAKDLVKAQGLDTIVEVIQGVIESVELPEKVDIIISEWMGYFLLRESMLDSVLIARDRFLKPGGSLYPSHARLFLAPIRSNQQQTRASELNRALEDWHAFGSEMRQFYGVDMSILSTSFEKEQVEYYSQTSAWCDVHPSQLLGPSVCFKSYDLLKVTLDELKAPLTASFSMPLTESGSVEAFAGFFDVTFAGSPENPTDNPIILSTAPDPTGATHWGQQCFFLHPSLPGESGDAISCEIEIHRRSDNHRLMSVALKHSLISSNGNEKEGRMDNFNIE